MLAQASAINPLIQQAKVKQSVRDHEGMKCDAHNPQAYHWAEMRIVRKSQVSDRLKLHICALRKVKGDALQSEGASLASKPCKSETRLQETKQNNVASLEDN